MLCDVKVKMGESSMHNKSFSNWRYCSEGVQRSPAA